MIMINNLLTSSGVIVYIKSSIFLANWKSRSNCCQGPTLLGQCKMIQIQRMHQITEKLIRISCNISYFPQEREVDYLHNR